MRVSARTTAVAMAGARLQRPAEVDLDHTLRPGGASRPVAKGPRLVRRLLSAAVVMAWVFVTVVLLGGGPALAAPVSVTKASCTAQGGTFARSQGVKTCTTSNPSYDCSNLTGLYGEEPAVTAGNSGYFGTYSANLCYQTTIVQTQKGTGAITTTSTTTLKSRTVLSYDTCGYFDSATFSSSYAPVYQCYDAGDVYPVSFYS